MITNSLLYKGTTNISTQKKKKKSKRKKEIKRKYWGVNNISHNYGMLLTPQYLLSYHISTFMIMPFACSSKKKIMLFALLTNFNRKDTKSLQFNLLLCIWVTIDRESMQHHTTAPARLDHLRLKTTALKQVILCI